MVKLSLDTGHCAWLLVAVLLVSLGCAEGGSVEGAGGGGGAGGEADTRGGGGMGGEVAATALEVCQAWCRNETRGPSCCVQDPFFPGSCLEGCFDQCEQTVAESVCLEPRVASLECQLALGCDDFFGECEELVDQFGGCVRRADAEARGVCLAPAAACRITEEECLSTFETGGAQCSNAWRNYISCIQDGLIPCDQCVAFAQPFDEECDWPSGASEPKEFVPQSCDTLTLPPAGCDAPCPGGNDPECGFGTYCEAGVCEADCITNADCARGDACSVRGRCLPTIFGSLLQCSFLDDPPVGCGASCPSGSDAECPEGSFCTNNLCDAQCSSDEQCSLDEQCSSTGRCEEIPLPECSAGRSLDETFTSDRESLTCDVLGVLLAGVDVELTAKPTAPLQPGNNTYDLQLAFTIDTATVNAILDIGVPVLRFLEITADVTPTIGSTTPTVGELQNTPLPCDVPLVRDTSLDVVLPVDQATWDLDDGTTQELTVAAVDIMISAVGIEISFTTGPSGTCSWNAEPPAVTFGIAP